MPELSWPPTEPITEDIPWHPVLPRAAQNGFSAAMGVGGLGHADVMAAMWCRTARDDAQTYYQAARHASWANWAIDRGEDWSPSEETFQRAVQAMWIAGCRLLISAHLAQQWVRRSDPTVEEVPGLRQARNSIEHLVEADFDENFIIATTGADERGKERAWDIKKLPEGHLLMGLGKNPLSKVFDAVDLEAVATFMNEHANRDLAIDLADSTYMLLGPAE